jgi:hypothetical protein
MHYEHNFAKTILKTMIGGKNTMKVKRNLQRKGIRPHLWLIIKPQRGSKLLKPTTPYVLIVIE